MAGQSFVGFVSLSIIQYQKDFLFKMTMLLYTLHKFIMEPTFEDIFY